MRKVGGVQLRAYASLLLIAAACGPVGPMEPGGAPSPPAAPAADPAAGGGGAPGGGAAGGGAAGGDGSGGVTTTGSPDGGPPAPGAAGGRTAWAHKMGGLGVEYTQDVAVAPDGSVVAFNVIGVRGEGLEQIGFIHLRPDGTEFDAQFENENGAALHFAPAGSFVIAPSGELVVAASGRCSGTTCPTVGGRAASGGFVAALSPRAAFAWQAALPGDVASNVAVDARGGLLVVARAAQGGVARMLRSDGTLAWERGGLDASAPCAVALDGAGGAVVGCAGAVLRLDARGAKAWERPFGDAAILAVRATATGAVVHGRYRGTLAVGAGVTPPAGAAHGYFVAALGGDGAPLWAIDLGVVQETSDPGGAKTLLAVGGDGTIVLVTGADACTAAVTKLDAGGALVWRRPLAVNGCGGRDLVVHGLAVAPSAQILVGGAMSAPVDFGTGVLPALATDAFVVSLAP